MAVIEFKKFPKIPRFGKFYVTITEKIDGTNAGVFVGEDGLVIAASRKRWIYPGADNFGFAQCLEDNIDDLRTLGPGMHWGEWWGQGIQRKYDLTERRFSLFDVFRWSTEFYSGGPVCPTCCHVVPIIVTLSVVSSAHIREALELLGNNGSVAAPGFMDPEGVVIYHSASKQRYKLTFDNEHKGEQKKHEDHPT